MKRALFVLAISAFVASPLFAAVESTYRADPVHSSATFTATHLGISHVSGIIPIKSATVSVPDGSNVPTSAEATFDPSGIDTRNSDRDSDLRSPHFFEVATYPKMEFASTKIAGSDATHFTMTGDLTMHGQSHPVTLDGQYLGRMTDQKGRTHIAYSAKTTIDRTQWGMTYGNPFAGNSIDIDIEVEAIKS
ncbi:MAG: YceI family protein [Candidatus Eremiobacteraeota bacterium]|nr:YceI family protein [Candidatus Eremiobacteraeota bacterium]